MKGKLVVVFFVWLCIFSAVAALWKLVYIPHSMYESQQAKQQGEQQAAEARQKAEQQAIDAKNQALHAEQQRIQGTLEALNAVPPLVFGRGSSSISDTIQQSLDELAEKLNTAPSFNIVVHSTTTQQGDIVANKVLANERATMVVEYLKSKGIDGGRITSVVEIGNSTAVTFSYTH